MDRGMVLLVVILCIGAVVIIGIEINGAEDHEELSVDRPDEGSLNLIMISVNVLRADRMECYGHHRVTAPNICEFAEENIMFEDAYAQSLWTMPSTASVFTGAYPSSHGAYNREKGFVEDNIALAEVLRDIGYSTAGFVGTAFVNPSFGFGQGFEIYEELRDYRNASWDESVHTLNFEHTLSRGFEWLVDNGEVPIEYDVGSDKFLFVEGVDVHPSYRNPEPYHHMFDPSYEGVLTWENISLDYTSEKSPDGVLNHIRQTGEGPVIDRQNMTVDLSHDDIDHIRAHYDAGIRYADARIGEFLDRLRDEGLFSDSIIVIFSDHGVNLADRPGFNDQLFSRYELYDGAIHVPLMMHVPGVEGRRIDGQVELVDTMPTILELLDVGMNRSVSNQVQGESLVPLISGRETGGKQYVFSENKKAGIMAVRTPRWKLIEHSGAEEDILLDMRQNVFERANLIDEYPSVRKELYQRLEEHRLAMDADG